MEYTVSDVAQWFLSKEPLTPKKLQKLVYYAYAWYLTLMNEQEDQLYKKLFDDKFEAWVHGPVSPQLYRKYKDYRYNEIDSEEDNSERFDADTLDVLEQVWSVYGKFNGNELESLTHQEAPWREARKGYEPLDRCQEPLSDRVIFKYYLSRMAI